MLATLLLAVALTASPDLPNDASKVQPLLIGSALPTATVRSLEGEPVPLAQVHAGKPTVLVFYRGGWCPFCNVQLSKLNEITEPLAALGYQIVALSPDSPESLSATLSKEPLNYRLYSDSALEAMRGFGIAFALADEAVEKLGDYGIDLEAVTGSDAHALPVPSVFVVDAQGVIQFHYVNPDYRVRVPGQLVLAAAQAALEVKPLR